jgi:predicted Rossmann fold nucleotide-binding protein DprA/Smf involved in DNA uptake
MPTVIAIIGSQEPSAIQLQALDRAIEWIRTEHPDATVVSGCAKGIDEHALRGAS